MTARIHLFRPARLAAGGAFVRRPGGRRHRLGADQPALRQPAGGDLPDADATASASPGETTSSLRRRHRTVHAAEDLPRCGRHAGRRSSPTADPDLAADSTARRRPRVPRRRPPASCRSSGRNARRCSSTGSPSPNPPSASAAPSPRYCRAGVIYDAGSTGVDDSLTLGDGRAPEILGKGERLHHP